MAGGPAQRHGSDPVHPVVGDQHGGGARHLARLVVAQQKERDEQQPQ